MWMNKKEVKLMVVPGLFLLVMNSYLVSIPSELR